MSLSVRGLFKARLFKARMFTFSLLLAGSMAANGQNTPQGAPAQIKDDLIKIEKEIGRANLECDYKYFDRIEGEDFLFIDASGGVTDKKTDMAGEKDCKTHEGKYEIDEPVVRVYGGTAVVNGRVTLTVQNKEGKTVVHRSRFTDVFVWRHERWELVAGHSSRIPEPKA